MREAEGLSRLHNTITDWPDSGYMPRIAFIPGAPRRGHRSAPRLAVRSGILAGLTRHIQAHRAH